VYVIILYAYAYADTDVSHTMRAVIYTDADISYVMYRYITMYPCRYIVCYIPIHNDISYVMLAVALLLKYFSLSLSLAYLEAS
jgi:hypothetical protein